MSHSRPKNRQCANPTDQVALTVNERILRECHLLYTDSEKGLIKIAEHFDLKLLAPRKKIIVLLIGNNSAGKSSFINWYIEEHVQRTGVAIETQGVVFVTSGRKRETLTGNATLHLYPHFRPLQEIQGMIDFLSTEISTSKQKKFSLVTFVDTPGLVDGDMLYPFDVNDALLKLGKMADLIFTFFDPIGQALCKRTLNLVEKLNNVHPDKMRFYLTKADDAGDESDRQRVMMQIVQELCKRPGLNRTGFDMPTIYIPENSKNSRCVNQIESVCKDIERTINQTIQNTLNALESDCDEVLKLVRKNLEVDSKHRSDNLRISSLGQSHLWHNVCCSLFQPFVPIYSNVSAVVIGVLAVMLPFVVFWLQSRTTAMQLGWNVKNNFDYLKVHWWPLLVSLVIILLLKWYAKLKPRLSRKEQRYFTEVQNHIEEVLKPRKQYLYREYLEQCVGEQDL